MSSKSFSKQTELSNSHEEGVEEEVQDFGPAEHQLTTATAAAVAVEGRDCCALSNESTEGVATRRRPQLQEVQQLERRVSRDDKRFQSRDVASLPISQTGCCSDSGSRANHHQRDKPKQVEEAESVVKAKLNIGEGNQERQHRITTGSMQEKSTNHSQSQLAESFRQKHRGGADNNSASGTEIVSDSIPTTSREVLDLDVECLVNAAFADPPSSENENNISAIRKLMGLNVKQSSAATKSASCRAFSLRASRTDLAPYWDTTHNCKSAELSLEESNENNAFATDHDDYDEDEDDHFRGIAPMPRDDQPPLQPNPAQPGAVAIPSYQRPFQNPTRRSRSRIEDGSAEVSLDFEMGIAPIVEDGLVVARAIASQSTEFITLAREVPENEISRTQSRKCQQPILLAGALVVVCTMLAIGFGLGFGLHQNHASTVLVPSLAPTGTPAPSASPSSAPTGALDMLMGELPAYSVESLETFGTPQWLAWDWLSRHPSITFLPEWQKRQLFALVTLYYSFEGSSWRKEAKDTWLQYDINECLWFSNTYWDYDSEVYTYDFDPNPCNEAGEWVQLRLNNIHPEHSNKNVAIPPEIELLTSLSHISLSRNYVGKRLSDWLPSQLYKLTGLTVLALGGNYCGGALPSELGLFTNMEILEVGTNLLTGPIPSEIGLLTSLKNYTLAANFFTGALPSGLELMTQLIGLRLGNNLLTGRIPTELGKISVLEHLELRMNDLTGPIPSQLGSLTHMTYLGLWDQSLSGTIPEELFSLPKCQNFFVDSNALTGTISTKFGLMTSLTRVGLHLNLFTGPIPSEIGLLSATYQFGTPGNPLLGTIPTQIGMMATAQALDFSYNSLSGPIPSQMGQLKRLEGISLESNGLSGSIPSELGLMSSMNGLSLRSNNIGGPIPSELGTMPLLQGLYLGETLLSGAIPSQLGLANDLGVLELSNMPDLTGSIPVEVSDLSLNVLRIGGSNQLSGTIADKLCSIGMTPCAMNYWWLEYRPRKDCVLEFDCSEQLCGCGCPCEDNVNGAEQLNSTDEESL